MSHVTVLLHNIRSAHNVGSIFRTADAAGVTHVYLSGYTPAPIDRFGRPRADIAKIALGAELSMPWTYAETPDGCIQSLKSDGWTVVGLEQDERALNYRTYTNTRPTLLVLGTEVEGMSPELRNACDVLIEIPMRGKKESLNVSVAAGIALYHLTDQ